MTVSNTIPFSFSQEQIENLKSVGVDLDTQKTADAVISAYEQHLIDTKKQVMMGTAFLTSQAAAIFFAQFGIHIPSAMGFTASAIFGFTFHYNKEKIERAVRDIKHVGWHYTLFQLSERDGMARAVDAHARNILKEAMKEITNSIDEKYIKEYNNSKFDFTL